MFNVGGGAAKLLACTATIPAKESTAPPMTDAIRPESQATLSPSRLGALAFIVIALLLCAPLAAVALATAFGWLDLPAELAAVDARLPVLFRVHMAAAALALLAVPAAIAVRKQPKPHRLAGRTAGLAIVVAGLTALPVAAASLATPLARAGFAAQALAWLVLLSLGYVAIRRRNVQRHRAFMLAVAAVTSAAIWLRPAILIAGRFDVDFTGAYAAIAWASWLVPLFVVALALRLR